MRVNERLRTVTRHIQDAYRKAKWEEASYPVAILDLIIFHKIHFYFDERESALAYRRLKSSFVDWNEVRISSIAEIQEVIGSSPHSLAIAVFIKDLLDYTHREKQCVDLESLAEENITEIRKFLKQIKGIDSSTISLVLRRRKDYPMLPVDPSMQPSLLRVGLVRPRDNRDQMGKFLHNLVDSDTALPFHHFFLRHSQDICPPDEAQVKCSECGLQTSCHFYSKSQKSAKARKKAARRR